MSSRGLATLQQNTSANRSSTALITPKLTELSDPPIKHVDAHLLEFLTAEVSRQLAFLLSYSELKLLWTGY